MGRARLDGSKDGARRGLDVVLRHQQLDVRPEERPVRTRAAFAWSADAVEVDVAETASDPVELDLRVAAGKAVLRRSRERCGQLVGGRGAGQNRLSSPGAAW